MIATLRDDVEISCGTRDVPSWIDSCIQWQGAGTELLTSLVDLSGVLAPDRIRRRRYELVLVGGLVSGTHRNII